ncbi:hypothetical protein TIFTF001_017639 [Ficus carica]|uniref:DUF8039 domain-containing protein n=1 Tax=Ficus carica TaxID=3494 RepID=A0AA88D8I7_FICCA|nr:hypothetical protein TIFTF001_017639 [Ficus carica]
MSKDHEEDLSTQTQVGKPRRTNSPKFNADEDGKRRATLLRRVNIVRTRGERIEVFFYLKGQPKGKEEFKRLSEQGSEIRKKSKYESTIGRDGYRKRDQEIDELSQQETQGSFESVGTDDILTKSLGNAEHSGRIRGQSKFVKQAQYFNVVNNSRDNLEVSYMKRQLAALERMVQELCAKHGINCETMAKEATAPIVDQPNSFKARCTLNEKEVDASDSQPMPNASKECQLFLTDLINGGDVLVAIGMAYMDCVPTDTVHGIPLGEGNVRVTINVPKLKCALIPIPINEATYIEEAVGGYLTDCCARAGMDQRFDYISPFLVSPVQQNVDRVAYIRERDDNIIRIIRNAPWGKLVLMTYNSGQH